MARVFTINFSHKGQDRSAVIAVRPTPFYTEYNVSLFDEDIAHDLHSTTIISSTNQQFRYQDCLHETELMQKIILGVTEHLHHCKQLS
jgi:hypothetical protein